MAIVCGRLWQMIARDDDNWTF